MPILLHSLYISCARDLFCILRAQTRVSNKIDIIPPFPNKKAVNGKNIETRYARVSNQYIKLQKEFGKLWQAIKTESVS
jgi:hypothetical protein